MDHFGIGGGVLGAVAVYMRSARRTGRTTSLVDSLKPGDRVCCATRQQRDDLERRVRERGLEDVTIIVLDTRRAPEIFQRGARSIGRTLFDHSWVEQYYLQAIEQIASDIDRLQRESSGAAADLEMGRLTIARWRD